MKLGLALPQFGPLAATGQVAEFARQAEALGYEALWVGDRVLTPVEPTDLYPGGGTREHPYPDEFTTALDPLVTLTAAAVATRTARLGMSTLVATWYQPLLLARALTSLDVVSGGRVDAGFGISWSRDEYAATGVEWEGRGRRLEEILDVLDALWTQNPAEHHGELFDIPRSNVDLRPVQPGGPPILLGGFTPVAAERAGRRAAGWLDVWGVPPEYAELLWRTVRKSAEAGGRDAAVLRRETRINLLPGQAVSDAAAAVERVRDLQVDGVFIDLNYVARTVEEAADLAAGLMSAVRT